MLVVFFTIVFIAELIVAGWIISAINKLRCQVARITLNVNQLSPEIISTVTQIREIAQAVASKIDATKSFVGVKSCECASTLKKSLLTTLLFNVMKLPGKKILTIIDIILTLRKFVKTFTKK